MTEILRHFGSFGWFACQEHKCKGKVLRKTDYCIFLDKQNNIVYESFLKTPFELSQNYIDKFSET